MAAAHGLEGGILIGLAAMLLWLGIGRIAGVSGIAFGLVRERHERGWRVAFVLALILGAALARVGFGARGMLDGLVSLPLLALAGFLVGYGTRLGNGCTSGHGVCGLGRLSRRSLVAVIVFMGVAMATHGSMLWSGAAR